MIVFHFEGKKEVQKWQSTQLKIKHVCSMVMTYGSVPSKALSRGVWYPQPFCLSLPKMEKKTLREQELAWFENIG